MKLKRILACTLTMLLMFSFLPVSAMAETINVDCGVTLTTDVDVNIGDGVDVSQNVTVGANYGDMATNEGTVETNYNLVETNKGTVNANQSTDSFKGTITSNEGTVDANFGTITTNEADGSVGFYYDDTAKYGELWGYHIDGSQGNYGTIGTNEGMVSTNGGLRFYADPTSNSGYSIQEHTGCEITTNEESGFVVKNSEGNSIGTNKGTVVLNDGTVGNNSGEVKLNCGTVVNVEGGTLYDYISTDGVNETKEAVTDTGTFYGIQIDQGWVYDFENGEYVYDENGYVYLDGYAALNRQAGETVDLSSLFTYGDYEVAGYFADDDDYASGTTYTAGTAPSYLQLVWGKLKAVIAPNTTGTEPVLPFDLPDSVAAKNVTVGTDVKVNGVIFRVIEMDEDSITVVTMCDLSHSDLNDPMAFLAKYLTARQLELLQSSPERISGELAARLFGGNTQHIVFKAAKNLFE